MMKNILLTLAFVFAPAMAQAATAVIHVDTGTASINALEGTIILPSNIEVESVRTGGSIILFWIEEPKVSGNSREIRFAGTTPGGFAGKRELFAITADMADWQVGGIWFTGVTALRNDGSGSKVPVKLLASLGEDKKDTVPPDSIYIEVGKSADLYDNRPFISFVSQDKNSGIARYEVAESLFLYPSGREWGEANSPYEVKDKLLIKKVFVKAIDRDGNERVGTIGLPNRKYALAFVAILILAICVIYTRRSRVRA